MSQDRQKMPLHLNEPQWRLALPSHLTPSGGTEMSHTHLLTSTVTLESLSAVTDS